MIGQFREEINQPAGFSRTREQIRLQEALKGISAQLVRRAYWEGNQFWAINLSTRCIGDSQLQALAALMTPPKRLELQLENSAVSDHGPASLEALKNVVQVDFGRRISDEGVAHLAKLAGLERLAFFGSKLTDHALDHLVGTKALHRLNLECKKVTDVGLGELHELKKLKELFIRGPRITEAGVDEIRKAIPGLQVSRWP